MQQSLSGVKYLVPIPNFAHLLTRFPWLSTLLCSVTLQHLQGAVPDSGAVLSNTSPELVLAGGFQCLAQPSFPPGYRETFKSTLKDETLGEKDSPATGTSVTLWRSGDFQPGFGGVILLFEVNGLAQHC